MKRIFFFFLDQMSHFIIPRSCCSLPLSYTESYSRHVAFILTVLQSEIFHSSVSLFFSLTPCITMSFICFAHIKARRNLKSLLILPSAVLLAPFSLRHTVDLSVCIISAGGVLIESRDGEALKYQLALREREEEVKKRRWRETEISDGCWEMEENEWLGSPLSLPIVDGNDTRLV